MSIDSRPLVSVVMAVYNGEQYLIDAVESIQRQTVRDIEVILIDDGSTDGSGAILEQRGAQDPRLRIVRRPHRGLTPSLNEGCRLARGEYIARMDADDVAFPDRLERQLAFLRQHARVAALGGGYVRLSAAGRPVCQRSMPVAHAEIVATLAHASALLHPSVTMRASAVAAVGGYRPAFLHAEDYDLWLRLAERYELANLPEPVLYYRCHAGQVSSRHVVQQSISYLAVGESARRRRATGRDPFRDEQAVTRDTLRAVGIDDATIDGAIAGGFAREAYLLRQSGAEQEAVALLRDGLRATRDHSVLGPQLGAVYRERARRHYRQHQVGHLALAVLLAARNDPRGLWSELYRRIAGGAHAAYQ